MLLTVVDSEEKSPSRSNSPNEVVAGAEVTDEKVVKPRKSGGCCCSETKAVCWIGWIKTFLFTGDIGWVVVALLDGGGGGKLNIWTGD